MPPNNRIRRLRDLVPGDLSQDKLDTFSRELDALAQEQSLSPPVLRPASRLRTALRRRSPF